MSTLNEITGMIDLGMEVSIVSLKRPAPNLQLHDVITRYRLTDRTYYLDVLTNIKKRRNIILRTLYGLYRLAFKTAVPLRGKVISALFALKKKSRRVSLVHLVDLMNYIARKKPDVLYFHFAVHAGELIILRKVFRIPFVVFFHGYDFSKRLPYDELNYAEMFSKGDWFFANSSFSGSKVEGLGCPAAKLSVPGLPVDDQNYPYKPRRKGVKVRLLTVARLVEKKGLEYSLRAVAECMKSHHDIEYEIIGDGPLRGELDRLISELGLGGKAWLTGSLNKQEVVRHMLDSDIFILTSVTALDGETEGLGMVLLESQLTGMPVIATLHNGFTDAVRDGDSGFLVPERDSQAIAERLDFLLNNPQLWEKMGRAGRKHVLENYRVEVYLQRILQKLHGLGDEMKDSGKI